MSKDEATKLRVCTWNILISFECAKNLANYDPPSKKFHNRTGTITYFLWRNQGQERLRGFEAESWIRKGIFKLSFFSISLTGVTSSSVFLSLLWYGDFDSIFSAVYLVCRLPLYWSGKVLRILKKYLKGIGKDFLWSRKPCIRSFVKD